MHLVTSSVLRKHIRVFQFLGFITISLHPKNNGRKRMELILCLWCVMVLSMYSSLTAYVFVNPDDFLFTGDAFGHFNDSLKVVLSQIAISITYLESLVRREDLRKFWELFIALQNSRKSFSLDQKGFIHQIKENSRFLFIFYGLTSLEFIVAMNLVMNENLSRHLIFFWSMFLPFIYNSHFRNMEFIFHLELIRKELLQLRNDLNLLADFTQFGKRGVRTSKSFDEFIKLQLTRKQRIYQQIYKMYDNFQKTFGISLVLVIVMVYIRVLVDAYFLYYTSFTNILVTGEIYMILPAIFEIPALLIVGRDCMDVMNLIKFHLHNIKTTPNDDSGLSMQVENFSMQILHQRIIINCFGFSILDGYMLTRALGSITTFMIFFIQFMPKFKRPIRTTDK